MRIMPRILTSLAALACAAGMALAEEPAAPGYTLPGDMGGPGSAVRISRGPAVTPEPTPEIKGGAVRVSEVVEAVERQRIAAAEARARAEAERQTRYVIVPGYRPHYRPVTRPGSGFRLVIDKDDVFLSIGNGPLPRPQPAPPGGVFAAQ